ncbi:MAG: DUF5665 domain-containing protein [bacterium]
MKDQANSKQIKAEKIISLDGVMEILTNPKKLFWLNFKAGFVRGFAGVLGAALAIILISLMVAKLGGVPVIGEFIKQIGSAVKSAK